MPERRDAAALCEELARRDSLTGLYNARALRELLAPLDIDGRVVTADALHTQRETARFLVEEKNAHYLFTVKDNQKTLAEDLDAFDWQAIPPSAHHHR